MAYISTLEKLSERLLISYRNTIHNHPVSIGTSREKEIIAYLQKVMPNKYLFKSGELFDSNENISGQIDIIILDAINSVIFSDESENIVAPIESSYGVISVKSLMGKKELRQAIEGIKKYESLVRTPPQENTVYVNADQPIIFGSHTVKWPVQNNINCIFAFDTKLKETEILKTVSESKIVDLLIVPGKFIAFGRVRPELEIILNKESVDNFLIKTNKSVPLFTLILQGYLKKRYLVAREPFETIRSLIKNLEKDSEIITIRKETIA